MINNCFFIFLFWNINNCCSQHGFQNRSRLGGWTVKTGNRDENRFFKQKESDFLLIP